MMLNTDLVFVIGAFEFRICFAFLISCFVFPACHGQGDSAIMLGSPTYSHYPITYQKGYLQQSATRFPIFPPQDLRLEPVAVGPRRALWWPFEIGIQVGDVNSYEQLLTTWNSGIMTKEMAKLLNIWRIYLWNLYLIISDGWLGYRQIINIAYFRLRIFIFVI